MSETFDQAVGQKIATLRQARGMSQSELAERVGQSFRQQTVLKIEKGSRPLKLNEAILIANALGVSPFVLWTGSSSEENSQVSRQVTKVVNRGAELRKSTSTLYGELVQLAHLLADPRNGVEPFVRETAQDCLGTDWGAEVNGWLQDDLRSEFGNLPSGFNIASIVTTTKPVGCDDATS